MKEPVFKIEKTVGTNLIMCDTQYTVESACCEEGASRFSQANDSRALEPDLIYLLGHQADTYVAQSVLNGTLDLSTIQDKFVKKLLQYIRMPKQICRMCILAPHSLST